MAELYDAFIHVAALFSVVATGISLWSMWHHLKHYHQPGLQRWVIRLLWMTPVYAITSWASLQSVTAAYYLDTVRDVYEGFVLYSFFNLLVNYLGGERAIVIMLHNRDPTPHLWPVYYWAKELVVGDPYVFLFIKRGILQYVYIKPVLAAITMLLKSNQAYRDGDFSLGSGYFWVTLAYNLSVSLSLYCLAIFFMATRHDLRPFRPVPKFFCVKAILFFSYWQSLAISILVSVGIIHNTDTLTAENMAVFVQDWLICVEMVFAAVGHWYSFSHVDFIPQQRLSARLRLKYAFRDAMGIKDIILDSFNTYTGRGFNYRAFDPVNDTLVQGPGERAQLRPGDAKRLMAGLRYAKGGTTKYWLPVDGQPTGEVSARTPLLTNGASSSIVSPSLGPHLGSNHHTSDMDSLRHYNALAGYTSVGAYSGGGDPTSSMRPGRLSADSHWPGEIDPDSPIFEDLDTPQNQLYERLFTEVMQLPAEGDPHYPVIDTSQLPRSQYTPRPRQPQLRSRGQARQARRTQHKPISANVSTASESVADAASTTHVGPNLPSTVNANPSPPQPELHSRWETTPFPEDHDPRSDSQPWNSHDDFYQGPSV